MATFHETWPDWEMGVKRIPGRNGYKSEGNIINVNILTLETDSVSSQALKCLLEELLAFG